MKYLLVPLVTAFALAGCSDNISGAHTFCYQKRIGADDVYGTGWYSDHRAEFEKQTGCTSALNCIGSIYIEECVDGYVK